MAYQVNIPQPGDLLSQSQSDILNNFIAIGNIIDPNLGNITLTTSAAPAPAANQISLYAASGTSLHIKTNATDVDMTTSLLTTTGWCKLPCGLIMKWGTSGVVHNTGSGNIIQLSVVAASKINTILAVSITPTDSDVQAITTYESFDVANQQVLWTYSRSFTGHDAQCKCIVLGI